MAAQPLRSRSGAGMARVWMLCFVTSRTFASEPSGFVARVCRAFVVTVTCAGGSQVCLERQGCEMLSRRHVVLIQGTLLNAQLGVRAGRET